MLRSSTAVIMPQLQQMQMTGQMGTDPTVSRKMAVAMSGFLLMIPGLISDVLAVLILIPPIQKLFRNLFMRALAKRQQAMIKMMGGMMGGMNNAGSADQNPFADIMRQMQEMQNPNAGRYRDSNVIDGEAHEVEPERQKIEFKDVTPKK